MDEIITQYISQIEMGKPLVHGRMGIIPLFLKDEKGPEYLTLAEAMKEGILSITESSREGSVPELMVVNRGSIPVLLLDGEELVGSKQNRVLNTTILIAAGSKTVIPVSCTEQGRWSYVSREFGDSGVIMASSLRKEKVSAVSHSLKCSRTYRSNQHAVWDGISEMQTAADIHSPTMAMKDLYTSREKELKRIQQKFPCEEHQRGSLIFLGGKIAGLEILSRDSAYHILHERIIQSYAIDLADDEKGDIGRVDLVRGYEFLSEIIGATIEQFPSMGLGIDYRISRRGIVGNALVHDGTVIHLAGYPLESEKRETLTQPGLSEYTSRRRHVVGQQRAL